MNHDSTNVTFAPQGAGQGIRGAGGRVVWVEHETLQRPCPIFRIRSTLDDRLDASSLSITSCRAVAKISSTRHWNSLSLVCRVASMLHGDPRVF